MKKILCLILAMLLVLPLAVACNNETKPPVGTGDETGDNTGDNTGDDTTPVGDGKLDITNLNFGDEGFHMVAFDWQAYSHYFFADEESSDPMESAIYNRKRTVEDEIGVKISHTLYPGYGEMFNAIDQNVGTGDDSIQMVLLHCISRNAEYTSNGTLYPIEKLPNVQLDADWWNQEQMDAIRLGKSTFLGVNDFMIPTPYVIFFNKDMVEELSDVSDPYELVQNDEWTLDVFDRMSRAAARDNDNNGVYDEYDNFGFTTWDGSEILSFWASNDQFLGKKNADGRLELVLNTEKAVGITELIADWSADHILQVSESNNGWDMLTLDSNQVLFWLAAISEGEQLRDTDVSYGILPYPKYDENQEDYQHLDWGGLMGISTTIQNPDLVGATIELLAYHSDETVIPAYYDIVLDGQLSQDPTAPKMLDIIFDTIVYDPAVTYFGLSGSIMQLFYQPWFDGHQLGNSQFASKWATNADSAQKQIDDYYTSLEMTESLNDMLG